MRHSSSHRLYRVKIFVNCSVRSKNIFLQSLDYFYQYCIWNTYLAVRSSLDSRDQGRPYHISRSDAIRHTLRQAMIESYGGTAHPLPPTAGAQLPTYAPPTVSNDIGYTVQRKNKYLVFKSIFYNLVEVRHIIAFRFVTEIFSRS